MRGTVASCVVEGRDDGHMRCKEQDDGHCGADGRVAGGLTMRCLPAVELYLLIPSSSAWGGPTYIAVG
jgi:hypothetical protein